MANQIFNALLGAMEAGVANGALRFDASKTHNVDHGPFWLAGVDYTSFYWDAFVRPTEANSTGYLISAGYGAEHDLLWGFQSDSSHVGITGNIWDGDAIVSYSSPHIIPLGDWVHIAVVWDLSNIIVYINGIAEGYTPYSSATRSTAFDYNASLFVGGSDHSNYGFDLKWVRGFEGVVPITTTYFSGYRPERYPKAYFNVSATPYKASFLADYSQQCEIIPDLSGGFGDQGPHPGRREVGANIGAFQSASAGITNTFDESLLPQWVAATVNTPTLATSTIPPTAVIYDDFNRDTSPFWSNTAGLGSTEGGTAGVKAWEDASLFAISYGRACPYATSTTGNALVDTGITDVDVRYTRSGDFWAFLRYTDTSNYIVAKLAGTDLQVIKVISGSPTTIISATVTGGDTEENIKITAVGTTVTVYYNGVSKGTYTGTLPTGTKAGFMLASQWLSKLDTFAVYAG